MSRKLALGMLDLEEDATPEQIEQAYWSKCAELEDRIHIAPTAELKKVYREALEKLEDIRAAALAIGEEQVLPSRPAKRADAQPVVGSGSGARQAGEGEVEAGDDLRATISQTPDEETLVVAAGEPREADDEPAVERPDASAGAEGPDGQPTQAPPGEAPVAETEGALSAEEAQVGFLEGRVLCDRFEVHHRLGMGHVGAVYEAYDRSRRQPVAIKVILPHLLESPDARERFLDAAKRAALLNHPNIVRVFDVNSDGLLHFLVMELVSWRTLRETMESRSRMRRPFGVGEVTRLISALCAALGYAHKHTLHLDVRPENVFVSADGAIKLGDFAVGSLFESGPAAVAGSGAGPCMAPELRHGGELSGAADQYSVAAAAFEALAGEAPGTPAQSITARREGLPPELVSAIDRALRERPGDRFPNVESFAAAVANAGGRPWWTKRRVIAAGVALTVVVGLLFWLGLGQRRRVAQREAAAILQAQSEAARIATQAQGDAQRVAKVRAETEARLAAAAAAQAEAERVATAAQAEGERVAQARAESERLAAAAAQAKEDALRATATRAAAELARAAEEARALAARAAETRVAGEVRHTAVAQATVDSRRTATARVQAEAERAATARVANEANRMATARARVEAERQATVSADVEARRLAALQAERQGAAQRQATVAAQPGYIPWLNATVVSLRFFEKTPGAFVAEGERDFADRFRSSRTRSVAWELTLSHPPQGRRKSFTVDAICYAPDGSVFGRGQLTSYVEANWGRSTHVYGWGFQEAGQWAEGRYRVELSIDGKRIASGSFEIYEGFF